MTTILSEGQLFYWIGFVKAVAVYEPSLFQRLLCRHILTACIFLQLNGCYAYALQFLVEEYDANAQVILVFSV